MLHPKLMAQLKARGIDLRACGEECRALLCDVSDTYHSLEQSGALSHGHLQLVKAQQDAELQARVMVLSATSDLLLRVDYSGGIKVLGGAGDGPLLAAASRVGRVHGLMRPKAARRLCHRVQAAVLERRPFALLGISLNCAPGRRYGVVITPWPGGLAALVALRRSRRSAATGGAVGRACPPAGREAGTAGKAPAASAVPAEAKGPKEPKAPAPQFPAGPSGWGLIEECRALLERAGMDAGSALDMFAFPAPVARPLVRAIEGVARVSVLLAEFGGLLRGGARSSAPAAPGPVVARQLAILRPLAGPGVQVSAAIATSTLRVGLDVPGLERVLLGLVLEARERILGQGTIRIVVGLGNCGEQAGRFTPGCRLGEWHTRITVAYARPAADGVAGRTARPPRHRDRVPPLHPGLSVAACAERARVAGGTLAERDAPTGDGGVFTLCLPAPAGGAG